ncbi:murein biosynthesis integral membrane protein MurJ [Micromonospora sp. NBC_01813]|uniref:murein biosynthesis integral membrane protein MurJ n=1 Tax=Micromonospora sp. NBC_01813 TaxID=2975988 RepID=UPI002DD9899D|nr:lipid II flippase MurJ [Micromonospora sp. NBC_01813]WSA10846.1 virulence factor MviN [Micromonospora sp. NBC_01813]
MTTAAVATRVAGAAALITVLTVASRLAGFGRTAVFAWSVGPTDLGDIYMLANIIPNIAFEIVVGGALASLVVPLLAGAVAAGERSVVSATTSALLTWTLSLLIPLAVVVALCAGPIVRLLADQASPEQIDAGVLMLRLFAPQLPLYGIAVVLTGVLQAHHRFAWPVVAPLLSSVTVIGTYLAFAVTEGRLADLPQVGVPGQALLAVGTTAGVAVLSLCLVVPVLRLGLRLRPGVRFAGAARTAVGGLAAAGAVTVGTQQVAVLVAVWLCFAGDPPGGSMVLFLLAQTVFLLPWSVLAVPMATAAYPTLAAAHSRGDTAGYHATLAPTARTVVLLACLGASALVAVCVPAAAFLVPADQSVALAAGIAGFAPGLIGYGLFAIGSRALYAAGRPRPAAGAVATGWCAAVVAALVLAVVLPDRDRVLALALANAIGMSTMGVLLVAALRRVGGGAALTGLGRATTIGATAGLAAALAGTGVTYLAGGFSTTPTVSGAVLQGMLSGATTLVVFLAVCLPLDRHDLRPLVVATIRRTRRLKGGARPSGKGTVPQ